MRCKHCKKGLINHTVGLERLQTGPKYGRNYRDWYVYVVQVIDTTGPYMYGQEAQQCKCNYMQIATLSEPSVKNE